MEKTANYFQHRNENTSSLLAPTWCLYALETTYRLFESDSSELSPSPPSPPTAPVTKSLCEENPAALCPHMASICSSQACFTLCNLQQQVRPGQGGSLWTQFQDLLLSLGAAGSPVFVKFYQLLIQLLARCSNNQVVP